MMSRVRYILLVLLTALALVGCRRRPMEEEYLRVYLDLTIDKDIVNYTVPEGEPGLMRVAFFDSYTKQYLSHDYVSPSGGYVLAPYGEVDIVVYNLEAGDTHIRNAYSWNLLEAYTDEISDQQRSRFTRFIMSRTESRPSYEDIRLTPDHLYVARKNNVVIPRHISNEVFVIKTTAHTVVESWTVELRNVNGLEYVGSMSMMLSGQVATHYVAKGEDSAKSLAIYFDITEVRRSEATLNSRFETFGRERTSGDAALLSVLFHDTLGHPYMYNFDVSDQMEDNPEQHIVIDGSINIPKPEVGGGFRPEVDEWKEEIYNIEI